MNNTVRDRYLVVGNPIAHSRSPEIHRAFAAQFDTTISYEKALVAQDDFDRFVRAFAADGGAGLNVTVPFKGQAFALVDEVDALAGAAAAVNTIKIGAGGRLSGFNTDGVGLVNDLRRLEVTLSDARVLLLGAGGAARGVVLPLLEAGIAELCIANRTVSRAEALVASHASAAGQVRLTALGFASISQPADIIINATSIGLSGAVAPVPTALVADAFCYDMSYGKAAEFARWAAGHGATSVADGLGMLVEQAAESYFIWHGVRPSTSPVIAKLRHEQTATS